ncbi:sigma-70 family RNA polymerase sigma factor [Fulvivirgaceae bacterium BMA12]|uniref:Sigma-70 family RNA polymerase sigma factor n=1 Tax=Agaribacillus aureus TaxID=3051825 RepID=A0ABT8LA10_9BACT|nr:sigma-70 family RNA polymerase sigma factor [Fulvivirgaceae bacterium BMA12]
MVDESQIISGCIKGDRKAQEQLFINYSKRMMVISMRYTKGIQEAEDVLQEAFIKVFKHIKNFKQDSSLYYWIKKIVVNTALNSQRSKLYLYPMVDADSLKESSGIDCHLSDYALNDLLDLIQSLPTGCQVIFNLYAIEGYKHHEIAKMLDISEGTSKSQYARARSLLQEKIRKNEQMSYEKYQRK